MALHRFTEMVAPPGRGRVFKDVVGMGFADCAPSGRVRLDGIARWLQDIAYADVLDAGLAEMAVWVVRRTRIQVRRYPRFGERLHGLTFCSGLGAMWGERRTQILREGAAEPDVESVALWVHLSPEDWRPMPFAAAEVEIYGEPSGGRRVRARLHHPAPPRAPERSRPWTFRRAEADIADHVNNAAYWVPIEEELLADGAEPEQLDAELEFREPAQPGEVSVLASDGMRWIVGEGGVVHASARLAHSPGFSGSGLAPRVARRLRWRPGTG